MKKIEDVKDTFYLSYKRAVIKFTNQRGRFQKSEGDFEIMKRDFSREKSRIKMFVTCKSLLRAENKLFHI